LHGRLVGRAVVTPVLVRDSTAEAAHRNRCLFDEKESRRWLDAPRRSQDCAPPSRPGRAWFRAHRNRLPLAAAWQAGRPGRYRLEGASCLPSVPDRRASSDVGLARRRRDAEVDEMQPPGGDGEAVRHWAWCVIAIARRNRQRPVSSTLATSRSPKRSTSARKDGPLAGGLGLPFGRAGVLTARPARCDARWAHRDCA
jgi:hypothetical protein